MKRVLVSGGSRGIGAAVVRAFAAQGDRVAFLYRTATDRALDVAKECGAVPILADVSAPASVKKAVGEAIAALGGSVDILVNNAGVSHFSLVQDTRDEDWRTLIDTDLSGAFYLIRETAGDMVRNGWGRIVNIGSMWGKTGASMEAAYSAAKAGLRGLTMSLAKELGPSHVTVNCVEPGLIDTEMNKNLNAEAVTALVEETPLCRMGTPSDVVAAVLFFASDDASFITGQCLGVDGGFAI